jgi:hypothetical protein
MKKQDSTMASNPPQHCPLSETEMRAKQTTNEELIADGLEEAINKARQIHLEKQPQAK